MPTIKELVERFVSDIEAALDPTGAAKLIREHVERSGSDRRNGKGRKLPKKFCLYPKCRNPFAPRFGGWCKAHRDIPAKQKAKIKAARA